MVTTGCLLRTQGSGRLRKVTCSCLHMGLRWLRWGDAPSVKLGAGRSRAPWGEQAPRCTRSSAAPAPTQPPQGPTDVLSACRKGPHCPGQSPPLFPPAASMPQGCEHSWASRTGSPLPLTLPVSNPHCLRTPPDQNNLVNLLQSPQPEVVPLMTSGLRLKPKCIPAPGTLPTSGAASLTDSAVPSMQSAPWRPLPPVGPPGSLPPSACPRLEPGAFSSSLQKGHSPPCSPRCPNSCHVAVTQWFTGQSLKTVLLVTTGWSLLAPNG